jgi:protein SCO1/2
MHHGVGGSGHVDHSAHKAMMKMKQQRSVERYRLAGVDLVNQDGETKPLDEFLSTDKLIVVDFIFTTCTTICPVLSAGLSGFWDALGDEADNVKLVSITIDPEHDTPEKLKAYGDKYNMQPGREFLTGSREDINAVMRSFDADMPNKMTHYPLTFFRGPGEQEWVRVLGLMSIGDMLKEYKSLIKS